MNKKTLSTLLGIILSCSNCAIYKTTSLDSIKSLGSIEAPVKKEIEYDKLTWQEAIKEVKTPAEAQDYLNRYFREDSKEKKNIQFLFFNTNSKGENFKENHSRAKGICIDYATSAAALLYDNGYPPLLLITKGDNKHAVFLYKTRTGFGALGSTPVIPIHKTIENLVKDINKKYNLHFKKYGVVDLDENFGKTKWISGNVNMQIPYLDKWTKLK